MDHTEWCDEPQHEGAVLMMHGEEDLTACLRVVANVEGVGEVWKIDTPDGPLVVVDGTGVSLSVYLPSLQAVAEMLTTTPEDELVAVALAMPACLAEGILGFDVAHLRAIGRVLGTVEGVTASPWQRNAAG